MQVNVTNHHIAHGERSSNLHNPIALAIQDLDNDQFAVVTPTMVHRICQHGLGCAIMGCGMTPLPEYAQLWLRRFNENSVIAPFSFTL